MGDAAGHSSRLTCRPPRSVERFDGRPSAMKHPRDDASCSALQTRRIGSLRFKNGPQLVSKGKLPSFAVLRLARLEPYDASVEIDLMPLQRQDLARQPPASDIGEGDNPAAP